MHTDLGERHCHDWASENFGHARLGDIRRSERLVAMAARTPRKPILHEIIGISCRAEIWPVIPFLLKLIIRSLRALLKSSDSLVIENLCSATIACLLCAWPEAPPCETPRANLLGSPIKSVGVLVLRPDYGQTCNRDRLATHAIPDPYPELRKPPPKIGKVIALPVLGGMQHDYRRAA